MTTGAKIAVGCAVAVVVVGVAAIALVGGAAWWVKGKTEGLVAGEKQIEELRQKANQSAFERPADGVIQEDRLLKFLEVRKRVYSVYEKHQADLEALSKKQKGDFSDLTKGYSMLTELRTAQAQAQADIGMSEDEYRFLVEQIYKTLWAAEVAKQSGGKTVSEAAGAAYEQAARAMEEAARQTAAGRENAREAAEDAPTTEAEKAARAAEKQVERSQEELEKGAREMQDQAQEVRERTKELDVPPANIALFRKYEAEIRKYAMSGLEWVGL